MSIIYISKEQALETHRKTIEYSGGGDSSALNIGYLYSALEHIQNDDYYPSFEDKLVHLVWSVNRNHSFSDGNKRLSITLGAQFLLQNGYLFCIERFLRDMENISYHLAAGRIDKDLLHDIIHSFLNGEADFDEELKVRILCAIDDNLADANEIQTRHEPKKATWKKMKLEDLFDIKVGGDLQDDFFSDNYSDQTKYPIYSNSLLNSGLYGYTSKPRFQKDSITITGRGDIGHAEYRNTDFDAIVRLLVLTPKKQVEVNCKYITYYINQFVTFAKESTGVPQLPAPRVKNIKINLPSLPEQTAITTLLSQVDAAIESAQKSIAAAERLKKSLMQNLLTGRMKPDGTFRKANEFKQDARFGKVPIGWEVKRIDELSDRKTDTIDPTKTDVIYDYIGLEHIVPGGFMRCGKGYSNETLALKVIFNKGDLLFGKLRPYLNKVLVADISGVGSTELIVLGKNENTNWIYLNFQVQRFLDFTKSMTAGTQHPRASWRDIKHYLICIPSDDNEREIIENRILSLETNISEQQQKITTLERLKKSLMQNLLTGKMHINATVIKSI